MNEKKTLKEIAEYYAKMADSSDSPKSNFQSRIESLALDPEELSNRLHVNEEFKEIYAALDDADSFSAKDLSALYKSLADSIKRTPEGFKEHIDASAMEPEQISTLISDISDHVEKYPEIWEAENNRELLKPSSLMLLFKALKEDTVDFFKHVK